MARFRVLGCVAKSGHVIRGEGGTPIKPWNHLKML